MKKETKFDSVFDAQLVFRVLLDAFSHPGKIHQFSTLDLQKFDSFHNTSAQIALSLFDNNIRFHCDSEFNQEMETYIALNTDAIKATIQDADYIFLKGAVDISNQIEQCNIGILDYPEKNATIIFEVEDFTNETNKEFDLTIELRGPGIQEKEFVSIAGLHIANLIAIQTLNKEFPLGIDLILTDKNHQILSIPRSITIQIINK